MLLFQVNCSYLEGPGAYQSLSRASIRCSLSQHHLGLYSVGVSHPANPRRQKIEGVSERMLERRSHRLIGAVHQAAGRYNVGVGCRLRRASSRVTRRYRSRRITGDGSRRDGC